MRRRAFVLSAVILCGGVPGARVSEASPAWQRVSMFGFGGEAGALAQSGGDRPTLYLAIDRSAIYRWRDAGERWRSLGSAQGELFVDFRGDAFSSSLLYRLVEAGLERSDDAGTTWTQAGPAAAEVNAYALAPAAPGVLYAATGSGLERSANRGASWSAWAFAGQSVQAVGVDPHDSRRLFAVLAGDDRATVVRSLDEGTSFETVASFPLTVGLDAVLGRFVFDDLHPGIAFLILFDAYYTVNAAGVLRTLDGGSTWTPVEKASAIQDLAFASNGTLLAATWFGVARSTDLGDGWQPALDSYTQQARPQDNVSQLLTVRGGTPVTYAAGAYGVWRSLDQGLTWTFASRGITAQRVSSVGFAPLGPALGLAFVDGGQLRTLDGGATWQAGSFHLEGAGPTRIAGFDPRDGRTAYGLGSDGVRSSLLYRTRDGGRTWSQLHIAGYGCVESLTFCEVRMTAFAIDPRQPNRLYLGGFYEHLGEGDRRGKFLLRSDDGFSTYQSLSGPRELRALAFRHGDAALLALACDGLRESRDGGTTWVRIGDGLPANLCHDSASLALDSDDPRRIYVGASTGGAFASRDGGRHFAPLGTRLAHAAVAVLLAPGGVAGRVVAGVPGEGVFVWDAVHGEWEASNAGLPAATFRGVLASDPRQPGILFAGAGGGLFRLDLGVP